jgi:hypothetical protein
MDAASQIGYKCMPMALELGMTAPEMMLFPYNKDPATGSRIPSMSTVFKEAEYEGSEKCVLRYTLSVLLRKT